MNVVITDAAAADLQTIGDFIAERNPRRAISFVRELVERCEGLAEMPHGFQLVQGYERICIRRRPYGDHLIFHTVTGDTIQILHVLDGAQDHPSILSPDD